MKKEEILIGIDIGMSSIKYYSKNEYGIQIGMFENKVQKIEKPNLKIDSNSYLIKYKENYYLIGTMAEDENNTEVLVGNINYKLGIYISIFNILTKVKGSKINLKVIIAPETICNNKALLNEMKNYIINDLSNILVNRNAIHSSIEDVKFIPGNISTYK